MRATAVASRQARQFAQEADRIALQARAEQVAAMAVADGTVISLTRREVRHGHTRLGEWLAVALEATSGEWREVRRIVAHADHELIRWAEDVGIIDGPGTVEKVDRRPGWLERTLDGSVSADACPSGIDPDLWLPVEAWLIGLAHEAKRDYARAYCAWSLGGGPEPTDPREAWADKARRRADRIMHLAEHG